MIDSHRKFIGIIILVFSAVICFFIVREYQPEFYRVVKNLILAGDVQTLSNYISSFGYWAFIISILLLIFCNIFGIPTIPFLTINGALFGLVPGFIISWIGEVIGIECSFHIGRIFLRDEARRLIERKNMLQKLDKYSSVYAMIVARAIPYSPNILCTAIAVLTKLSTRQHLRASLIGKIPSVAVEVLLGHDLIHFSEHGLRFIIILLITLGGFFAHHRYRKYRLSRKEYDL